MSRIIILLGLLFTLTSFAKNPEDGPSDYDTKVSFSPHGDCESLAAGLISEAKESLDIAVYSINNKAIVKAIEDAQKRSVKIRILTDHVQAASNHVTTLKLVREKFDLKLHSVNRIMHNKFAVADGKKVIEGSFNWTEPAQNSNAENCLVTDNPEIVEAYELQFDKVLWPENTKEKSDEHLKKIEAKLKETK